MSGLLIARTCTAGFGLVEDNKLWKKKELEREGMTTRTRKKYVEEFAKSDRLYHSPLFHMRRILNECDDEDPVEQVKSLYG